MKLIAIFLLGALAAPAQLALLVSPDNAINQKTIVPLALTNHFTGKTASAQTVSFSINGKPAVIGQPANWVVSGNTNRPDFAFGATNALSSVLAAKKGSVLMNV